ncbi:MAG TPA: hypothetical protein VL175_20845 [Pirellulales bacterium]|jgi:hypothetical protein|nr:hypothetical protein [Pirellulales bacterium]
MGAMMYTKVANLVFEYGLDCGNVPHSLAVTGPATPNQIAEEVTAKYGVRPLLISYERDKDCTLLHEQDTLLTVSGLQVNLGSLEKSFIGIHTESLLADLHYELAGVLFHCMAMVRLYSAARRDLCVFMEVVQRDDPISPTTDFSLDWRGSPEVYFEFDAVVSKAKRVLDQWRLVLWELFNKNKKAKDPPRRFWKTLQTLASSMPEQLKKGLLEAWQSFGSDVLEYRENVQHFGKSKGLSSCRLKRIGSTWGLTVLIPDDSKVQSDRDYKYDKKRDALSFCWNVTSALVLLTGEIISAAWDSGSQLKLANPLSK